MGEVVSCEEALVTAVLHGGPADLPRTCAAARSPWISRRSRFHGWEGTSTSNGTLRPPRNLASRWSSAGPIEPGLPNEPVRHAA